MIQRKQTLFLLQSLFFNIALFFIPNKYFITDLLNKQALYLIPVVNSSIGHYAAIIINCLMIILTLIVIFLFKKQSFQLTLSKILSFFWILLFLMILFCPFLNKETNDIKITTNYFSVFICFASFLTIIFACKLIKRDIELLKSSERIR
jgi:hypothetical protein